MGYTCNNPKDLKDVILRRLGAPVINVEVTTEQIYDCIQRSMELYGEYHYDGLNKAYFIITMTEEQAKSGLIQLNENNSVFAVTKILRYTRGCLTGFGGTTYSWFSDFVHGLSGAGGAGRCHGFGPSIGGLSMYSSVMSYWNMLQDILNPIPDYTYNSTNGQLKVFGSFSEGHTLVIEVYVKSFVDLDRSTVSAGAYGLTAGHSCGMGNVTPNDIYENPYSEMATKFKAGCQPDTYLNQNVYNVRWIKDYSTSLVKELNGSILAKHQGLQLPGGVTVDGIRLIEEARQEIETLRDELYGLEEPLGIIMG